LKELLNSFKTYIDKDLSFLDDFDSKTPNLLHHFLANAIMNGQYVVTTNFDGMIEKALAQKVQNKAIIPVITRKDFLDHSDPDSVFRAGKYPVYKTHGSKINCITRESTKDSLITTLTHIGREGKETTFSIAAFKKLAFHNLMRNRHLVVMGYSGGDEFDISPTLRELSELSTIVWINHTEGIKPHDAKIEKLNEGNLSVSKASYPRNNSERLLVEILQEANKWERHLEIYDLHVDTSLLVEQYLFEHLFPSSKKSPPSKNTFNRRENGSDAKPYRVELPLLSDVVKNDIACCIYYDVNDMKSTRRCAEKGLRLAKRTEKREDSKYQIDFLKWLGILSRFDKKFLESNEFYERAIKISERMNASSSEKAHILNEIGRNYEHQQMYDTALKYYEHALTEVSDTGNLRSAAIFLNNIANIDLEFGRLNVALSKFEEVLQIAQSQKEEDLAGIAFSRLNIAATKFRLRETETAIQECNKAIQYAGEIGDLYLKSLFLTELSSMYDQSEEFELSLRILDEILKIYQLLNHPEGVATTLFNIGASLVSQNLYSEAIRKYKDALEIFMKLNNHHKIAELNHHLAGIYFAMNEFVKALIHEKTALEIAYKLNLPERTTYEHYLNIIQSNGMGYSY